MPNARAIESPPLPSPSSQLLYSCADVKEVTLQLPQSPYYALHNTSRLIVLSISQVAYPFMNKRDKPMPWALIPGGAY